MKIFLKLCTALGLVWLANLMSCDNHNSIVKPKCPPYDIVPESPYDDPIWHPSGNLIGFNHRPIKDIKYTNGYDCPHQAAYKYEDDSLGFWIIDITKNKMKRFLPYYLYMPDWSPDGRWIAFMDNSQIFKMPFVGEKFDTTAIQQLTFEVKIFLPRGVQTGSSSLTDGVTHIQSWKPFRVFG